MSQTKVEEGDLRRKLHHETSALAGSTNDISKVTFDSKVLHNGGYKIA